MMNTQKLGIVIIGRNEGERLRRCMLSVLGKAANIVYVDSGSTDNSVNLAISLSVDVVNLDLSIPFTASRARNAGFNYLVQLNPCLQYIQFIDGDCELTENWLTLAQQELEENPKVAVVLGRLRERYLEQSIYHQLCDMEWNVPVGEVNACGGIAMMRINALKQVEGFNPSLIAGEEPELCLRLRQKEWKIWCIKAEMGFHDAQITQFRQWWKRNIRGGYACANGVWLHGKSPLYYNVKESLSIWFWGFILPLIAITLVWPTHYWSLILFCSYPLQIYRVFNYQRHQGLSFKNAFLYSFYCLVSKFPAVQGQIKFYFRCLLKMKPSLIEYKKVSTFKSFS